MIAINCNYFAKIFIQILLSMTMFQRLTQAIYCLVIKPGHGLISERCSQYSVACRVRVENDAITWYTSKLYDRNQLACVMRNEYGARGTFFLQFNVLQRSGCIKKLSGSVRCWCYGQSNCNSPENMIRLYEAFKTGDSSLLDEVIDDIETSDVGDYDGELGMEATSARTTTVKEKRVQNKTGLLPSILIESDSKKQQNFEPKIIQAVKTMKISPSINDKLNETEGYLDAKYLRNQNDRKIRQKEAAGSGLRPLHKLIMLCDTIAIFLFSFIMF